MIETRYRDGGGPPAGGAGPRASSRGTARASRERGRSGSSRCYSLLCRRRRARAASIPPQAAAGDAPLRNQPTQNRPERSQLGARGGPTGAGGKTAPRQQAEEHSGCRAQRRDRSARGLLGHRHPRRPPELGETCRHPPRRGPPASRRDPWPRDRGRTAAPPTPGRDPPAPGTTVPACIEHATSATGPGFRRARQARRHLTVLTTPRLCKGRLPPITGTSRIGLSAGAVGDDGLLHRTGEAVPQGTGGPPARCPRDGTSSDGPQPERRKRLSPHMALR